MVFTPARLSAWLPLFFFLFLAAGPVARAQAPAWQTAISIGGGAYSDIQAAAADGQGHVFVVGHFEGTAVFGTTTLLSAGGTDAFIAKWDRLSNSFVWAQRAGGTGADYAVGVAVQAGRVYVVAGNFASVTAGFGGITLASAGGRDAYVASLTDSGSSGAFRWAQRAGSTDNEAASGVAVSGANVYLTGIFNGTMTTIGNTVLVNAGLGNSNDVFIAKLMEIGGDAGFVWAQRAGSNNDDYAAAVAVQGSGVYVAGQFVGPTGDFGPFRLTNAGGSDVFVTKLTDAGPSSSFAWAQRAGGADGDYAADLAVNGPSVYVAGGFESRAADFGSTTIGNVGLFTDVFVAKLTDAGPSSSFAWAQRAGGVSAEQATSLAVVGSSVYVAGYFTGEPASFGSTVLTNALLGTGSPADVFVAKLDDQGASSRFSWAQQAGGTGYDVAAAIAAEGSSVYVGGAFDSRISHFGSLTLASGGSTPAFFASLTDTETLTVRIEGDTLLCNGGQLSLTATPSAPATAYLWNTGATSATIPVTQPGTYTVTATFSSGVIRTSQRRVFAFSPLVGITGDSVLCSSPLNLLGLAANAMSYQWSTGAATAALAVTQPGTYALTVRFGNGCSTTRRVTVRVPTLAISGPSQVCPGGSGVLTAVAPGAVSYRWSTGATTASVAVSQAGSYSVVATFPAGCTLSTAQAVTLPVAAISGDSLVCAGRSVRLTAAQPGATAYQWSTGATTAAIEVAQAGLYSVVVTYDAGCQRSASQRVRLVSVLAPFSLGLDTTVCEGTVLLLRPVSADNRAGVAYRWSTGGTAPTLLVQQAGTYTLQLSTVCETRTVSRSIGYQSCVTIPNIITPNHDGHNDQFVVLGLTGNWALKMYTRWGQQVFSTNAYRNNWGADAAPGLYYYWLQQSGAGTTYKGWLEIAR